MIPELCRSGEPSVRPVIISVMLIRCLKRAFLLMAALPVAALPQNLPDLGESAQADFTPQQERRMGDAIMRKIRQDPAYIEDREVAEYVSRIGHRLTAAAPEAAGQSFEFFAVRDGTVNAFALPGGNIGVHSGLLLTAQTESEFAGVMAHEIAHVLQRHIARQLQSQNQLSKLSMVGMVLAILAARSNPQVAQAAAMTSGAVPAAAFLNYSRDFEREADRTGFQTLQTAGFDVQGMPDFFGRLQKATRLYENNAPGYLRTHPLDTERIADMQNRVRDARPKQNPSSVDFQLVRALLRATQSGPDEDKRYFANALAEGRVVNEGATRYGYANALLRTREFKEAETQLASARKLIGAHPMLESLGARIKAAAGDQPGATQLLANALKQFSSDYPLRVAYAEALLAGGQPGEALDALKELRGARPDDASLYMLKAKVHSALGQHVEEHRALAEYYYVQGSLPGAIQQLELAQSAPGGDFYSLSAVDARLRDLKREREEEIKDRERW
jgi:beta-barrel assembly-enhancing protease